MKATLFIIALIVWLFGVAYFLEKYLDEK